MRHQILLITAMAAFLTGCHEEKKRVPQKVTITHESVSPCSGGSCIPNSQTTKTESHKSILNESKQLWASSFLWTKAPELIVEKWIRKAPKLETNKFIILEFWNTWCPPCRQSLAKLTKLQTKFKDDIIVIALTDDSEEKILGFEKKYGVKLPNCYIGSSPQAVTKKAFGVRGVPHAVIIEPEEGCVIWEGFPLQKGYELTEQIIERMIKISKQQNR
jgi:thiol-disulfide isomerase/thioredoxin